MDETHGKGLPYEQAPMINPFFGQPEDSFELINKYGTYNVQPTNEQENRFPAIMQALPKRWRGTAVGKEELERPEKYDKS